MDTDRVQGVLQCLARDFPRFAAAAGKVMLEEVLPPMTDRELNELEAQLGVSLPDSYKRLLRCTRGFWLLGGVVQLRRGHPFFHHFPSWSALGPLQRRTVQLKGGGWPPPSQGLLCFAEFFLEADGDQVLFDIRKGRQRGEYPVLYYAHERRPPSVRQLAGTFAEFIERCLDYFPGRDTGSETAP